VSDCTDYILITGASGGFGLEFARQLEERGHNLVLHGRDQSRLLLTLNTLRHPDKHRIIVSDLNAKSGLNDLLTGLKEYPLSGLINNAGFGIWGSFEQTGIVPQVDVIKTDLKAPIELTHALLPRLIKNHGFIINVSSLAGVTPLPYMSTYAAAKAGLTYWSEALRTELDGKVSVTTLAPGPSPTGFRDVSGMPAGPGSFFRTPASTIITACLNCMDRGGGYCVPGWRHRLLFCIQKLTPNSWALRIMSKHLRP